MKFSVCVASVRPLTLASTISSIQRQTFSDWELIVVGQGNDDSVRTVVDRASDLDNRIRYVHNSERGLSRARNAGINAACGEIIAMVDDDCEAEENWLSILSEYLANYSDVGLIGGALVGPRQERPGIASCPTYIPREAMYDPSSNYQQPPVGWGWVGGNFCFRRSAIHQVGLFDQYLGAGSDFPAGEDTDFGLRLEANRIKMFATPRAIVYHTYGYRYGIGAVLRSSRAYAAGNGGLAGKLSLMGDPRGRQWLHMTMKECLQDIKLYLRPHRFSLSLRRLYYFIQAYNTCIKRYYVKEGTLRHLSYN